MTIHFEGRKSQAICGTCGGVRPTTAEYRAIQVVDNGGIFITPPALCGVCDVCGNTISTYPEATPFIYNRLRQAKTKAVKSVELHIPAVYTDMLQVIIFRLNKSTTRGDIPTTFQKQIILYYIRNAEKLRQEPWEDVTIPAGGDVTKKRISFKVTTDIYQQMQLEASAHFSGSITKMLRALINTAYIDIVQKNKVSVILNLLDIAFVI